MALRVNAAAAGKLHDRGHTADPSADISVHYRSGARGGSGTYSSHIDGGSLRGGSMRGMKGPESSSRGGMRRFTSLRGSRSGVELSSMDQDGFRRRTTSNETADLSGSGSGRSREGPQASKGTLVLQLLLVGMKREERQLSSQKDYVITDRHQCQGQLHLLLIDPPAVASCSSLLRAPSWYKLVVSIRRDALVSQHPVNNTT